MGRMNWNHFKRGISILLVVGLLSGCGITSANGNGVSDKNEADEELIDPVVGIPAYDVAAYRTLYDAEVYPTLVCPAVEEYTYETEQAFGSYGKLPGEAVETGDVLLYGNTEDIDEQIEELNKSIREEEVAYGEDLADYTQDLAEAKEKEGLLGTDLNAILANGPESESSAYEGFAKMVMPQEGAYKKAALSSRRIEQQIKELRETYELTAAHNQKLLELLEKDRNDVVVKADSPGNVVAAGLYAAGSAIAQGTSVMAVADLNTRQFQTEFIDQSILKRAQDIYALVDGVRYEVTPEIIDKTQYQRLQAQNGVVYTTFHVENGEDLPLGQYGVIVIVAEMKEDVLCVPTDAVKKEGSAYYVNVYDNGDTIHTEVKIGMRDGLYTEILTGIASGDKVLSDQSVPTGKTVEKLKKGSITGEFSETGFLFYPCSEWIKNPAKTGTCYLKELCVSDYEQVEKGQVLARIEVIPDTVEIGRLERKIQREKERLAQLEEEKSKDYSEKINYTRERAIRARNKSITKLNEQIDKLQQYAGIQEITAPGAGIVMATTEREEGDLIESKEALAELCSFSQCYILVEDDDGRLSYGNEVTITYKDAVSMKQTARGRVVTVNQMSLSSELAIGYALVAIEPEDLESMVMSGSGKKNDSGWYRTRFTVETTVRAMENVVLVPKTAVKEVNGSCYVRVKSKEGVSYRSFIPGGADLANYWVAEGLTEGMEICLD